MGTTYLSASQTPPKITPVTTKTAAATLKVNESGLIRVNADNVTITLPTAVGYLGLTYIIKQVATKSAGITIATTSSQTMDGSTTLTDAATYDTITVVSNGTNWSVMSKIGTWS